MDVRRLIEEVRKRPELWNMQYRSTMRTPNKMQPLWQEVADAINVENVEDCKRKWKNLRDSYRRYVSRCKREGKTFIPKGQFFDYMEFIREQRRYRKSKSAANQDQQTNEENQRPDSQAQGNGQIKCEPIEISDFEEDSELESCEDNDDLSMDEFQNIPIQELSNNSTPTHNFNNTEEGKPPTVVGVEELSNNSTPRHNFNSTEEEKPSTVVIFNAIEQRALEGNHPIPLKPDQKEQNFEFHKQQTLSCPENMQDSELNFLISFLPHLKKMNDLQNLQFRVKMSELVWDILSPSLTMSNTPYKT
ncbi:uncharacterized protein LOC131994113 [Stomoxys calcitrans]|nr:uncharacterized protein LOC131994113 [Stomoxys calcitrans]